MFALNLLGGAVLQDDAGPVAGRAAHTRRLALLAILAVARGRGVARERLIGLLWPDQRSDAARDSLSESLYVLRKELGDGALVNAGGEIVLGADAVCSDVAEFQQAVEEGNLEAAVRLYRGPFLDGFYVGDASEFERWAESERARLAHVYAHAVECLAQAAEGEGRLRDAAEWWRRLAVQDPYSSVVGVRLVRALDAAGERAGALWFARTHVALLREELGVEPDEEFTALVERLESEPVRMPPAAPAFLDAYNASPDDATAPWRDPEPAAAAGAGEADGARADEGEPVQAGGGERVLPGVPERAAAVGPPADADEARVPASTLAAISGTADALDPALPSAASPPANGSAAGPPAALLASEAAQSSPSAAVDGDAVPSGAFPETASVPASSPAPSSAPPSSAPESSALPPSAPQSYAPSSAPPSSASAGSWRGARREGGMRARLAVPAGLVGLLIGMLLALPAASRGGAPEPAPAPGYDPRRIAVLYFDDNSDGGELGWITNGLTEMLIHTLSQVPALTVISRNGVKPYRDHPVRFDSMVADLRVGSVVEGSVQRSGDSVRVTVQLIDANANAHLESRTVTAPLAGVFALEDSLSARVSEFLRKRLGHQIQLRQTRAETGSEAAWRWTWQAEQARDDAARLARTGEPLDGVSAGRRLMYADSLLARAEAADPRWTRPVVLRGWVAYRRAMLPGAPAASLLESARRQADRVLVREPANAVALELRGTLLLRQGAESAEGAGQDARLEAAERDLRAAVAAAPTQATAWRTLSLVLRYRGSVAESDMAGRRALAEDAYLEDADDILHRLSISALLLRDYAEARSLCGQLHRAPPDNWRFLECRLTLLRDDPTLPPDPAEASRLLAELERVDPAARAVREGRAYSPVFRLALAAGVLARARQAESARALLARARAAAGADPELHLSLGYDEAVVLVLLGDRAAARERLDQVLARRPALRPLASRDPLLRELFTPARR